jgi:hypothetical protein
MCAVLSLAGCSHFFIVKDRYDAVKKVALVQYAINPHFLLGTPNADESKWDTAESNIAIFAKELGSGWQVMPKAEMIANPAYTAASKELVDGWYTAKGMRFFSDQRKELTMAMLTPDQAKSLAAGLGVDAVAVIADSWGIDSAFFTGHTNNDYVISLYAADGTLIYTDAAYRNRSDEGFAVPPGGAVATDVPKWVLNNNQSFTAAVAQLKARLAKN